MSLHTHAPCLQDLLGKKAKQHAVQRVALAAVQRARLDLYHPALVLAPVLGQPITLSNFKALEQWVMEQLEISATSAAEADEADIERLYARLHQLLSEGVW